MPVSATAYDLLDGPRGARRPSELYKRHGFDEIGQEHLDGMARTELRADAVEIVLGATDQTWSHDLTRWIADHGGGVRLRDT